MSSSNQPLIAMRSVLEFPGILFGLMTLLLPLPDRVQAAPLPLCVHARVRFDGSVPLQFDQVSGLPGARLYIHASYPDACNSRTQSCGKKHAYLLTGDEVAVGKSCGKWSYIQYIGPRHITKGWVYSSRLNFLRKVGTDTAKALFSLTKGRGTPVCEAYLERLNVTDYYSQNSPSAPVPYCKIPENDAIPGFALLHRVPLPTQQLIKMSGVVFKWWERPNPLLTADWDATPNMVRLGGVVAWRYDPPLDVRNNGKRENIVMWRGYGLSGSAGRCGEPMNQNYTWSMRWQQLPLIMKGDMHIDQARTAEVFGRISTNGPPQREKAAADHPFIPVGFFITPFVYRGTIYFSAFFDEKGDYEGKRRGDWRLWNVMGVLMRRQGRTREICEYRLRGDDYPKADTGLEQ